MQPAKKANMCNNRLKLPRNNENSLKTHDMDQRFSTKRHMKPIEMETQNLTAQI